MGLPQAGSRHIQEPGADDSLCSKGCVPQLRAVVSLHLEPILCDPQVVIDTRQVPLKLLRRRVVQPAGQHVDGLVDGPDVHVACVPVLIMYVLHALSQRLLPQPGAQQQRLGLVQGPPEHILDEWMWVVQVLLCHLVARSIPVDAVIRHGVQLLPDGCSQRGLLAGPAPPIHIRHGQVHHAAVAPEAAWVQVANARQLGVRQQPHLRGHGVQAIPGVHAQHSQPELAP
mmetsp:Transcript_18558/g.52141  ORF Transcript_18558/g.52141 Transcript_18558/m.52141 type:complete len:228 (+) Transcript_18558:1341-2024(+)